MDILVAFWCTINESLFRFFEWVTCFRRENRSKRGYIYANLTEIVLPRRMRSTVIPERTSGKRKHTHTVREKERKKYKCSAKLKV